MRMALALSALVLASCEAPPVFATADKQQNAHLARIEGHVIVSTAARGNVVVSLYDAAAPPPPVGTGKAIAFTVVPRDAVFANATPGLTGPFTAPFSFSLVGRGRYLVRGFVDANDDFVPWYTVTAEPNAGDIGGGLARVIEVGVDDAGTPSPALDVPVSFSELAKVPVDRPAFELDGGFALFELNSAPVGTQKQPVFLVHLVDANGDGVPDLGSDAKPLVWPRVQLRKVSEADVLVDEGPSLSATIELTTLMPQLVDGIGHVNVAPTRVTRLTVVGPGGAAAGRYAVVVIQETGQTWRVPNELAPGLAETRGFIAVPTQGVTLAR